MEADYIVARTWGEIARIMDCSVATVKRRVQSGKLIVCIDGGTVILRNSDYQKYLEGMEER